MKKQLTAIFTSFAVAVTACCAGLWTSLHTSAENEGEMVRILAAGDSITHGYINGDNGYRKYLCYELQQQGITDFDMVGPNNSWSNSATYDWNGTTITYDPQHAGYSGYAIREITGRSGLQETIFNTTYSENSVSGNMLEVYQPDIILLQIGTNDLLDCQLDGVSDRLEELVDKILPYVSGDGQTLFLASVPPIDAEVRNDWLGAYSWRLGIPSYSEDPDAFIAAVDHAVADYNASVKALVEKKQAEGAHIQFSDVNSVVDMKTGLEDGVHPNESGYAAMGKHWAGLLTEFLTGEKPVYTTTEPIVTTATTITTTTTTTITTTTTNVVTSTEATTTMQTTNSTTVSTTIAETTTDAIEQTTKKTETTTESVTALQTTTQLEETSTMTSTTESDPLPFMGDVNFDGEVSLADVVFLTKYLLGEQTLSSNVWTLADLDQNGRVNGMDLALLRQLLINGTKSL